MLMTAAPVLPFDEPFTGLDFNSLQTVMAIMKQVARDCPQAAMIIVKSSTVWPRCFNRLPRHFGKQAIAVCGGIGMNPSLNSYWQS